MSAIIDPRSCEFITSVTRRDGNVVPYDESKLLAYLNLVSDDLIGIDVPGVLKISKYSFYDKMATSEILDVIIRTTIDRISVEVPDYQNMAARLQINVMRRAVWNSWNPTGTFHSRIVERIEKGVYDPSILEKYTREDIEYIDRHIVDHSRDLLLTYVGIRQFLDKYLIKDRVTNVIYETPQEANILICMCMFMNYEQDVIDEPPFNGMSKRMYYVKMMYDKLSTFVISLPTPIYAGVRSNIRSFSSCCVLDCGDTTRSILSTTYVIGDCITKRYGIGVNIGKIRGLGASVHNGSVIHTGVVPFLKMFEATTKGFIQNGIRGGGGTISFPFWHWEVSTLLELKNNKGVVENRVRSLDYSIGLNKYFITKAVKDEPIWLFSAEDVPLLSNDYTYDYNEFVKVYEGYVGNPFIRKQSIPGLQYLKKIVKERYETGRIYIYFMDNMNNYGTFDESIFSSNLCQEIALPTRPVELITDGGHENTTDDGLVAVCILSCINVGRLDDTNTFKDMYEVCDIIVRFLNEMIDYQVYDFEALRKSAQDYRPLGIGISDVFHLLAMRGLRYDTAQCRNYLHKLCEHFQYCLLKASCNLAREKGHPCKAFNKSKYSRGIMPMDRYKSSIDTLITDKTKDGKIRYYCDWDVLRKDILTYGMYNTCLSAIPPTATSCLISNSTPGIDPPRSEMTAKVSKYGAVKQVMPDWDVYKDTYTLSRHVNNDDYFKMIGVIQKWIDQGISTNSYYMSTSEVSFNDVMNEVVSAYKWGLKSLYYLNSNKGVDEDNRSAFSSEGIKSTSKLPAYSLFSSSASREQMTSDGQSNGEPMASDGQTDGNNHNENHEEGGCAGGACSV